LVSTNSRNLSDPKTVKEALRPDKEQWKISIKSKLESLKENVFRTAVKRSSHQLVIGTRRVFKINRNSKNEPACNTKLD